MARQWIRSRAVFAFFSIGLLFSTAGPAINAQQDDPRVAAEMRQLLEGRYPDDQPGAAVLVARHGEILIRDSFGLASLELGVKMRAEMNFCIGSVTKTLTAAAVLRLVDGERLSLDDEVSDFLPTVKSAEGVRLAHLLSHSSGIPDFGSIDGYREKLHVETTPDDLIDVIANEASLFEPGTVCHYSNPNYAALARIIEIVTETSWEEYLKDSVFTPANMRSTYYGGHHRVIANAASSYAKEADGWRRSRPLSYTRGYGLGGLFSNVDDMYAFYRALVTHKLIDEETLARAWTRRRLHGGSESQFGLGFEVSGKDDERVVHHGGAIFGWTAHMSFVPAHDVFAVVLTNHQSPDNKPHEVTRTLLEIATRDD